MQQIKITCLILHTCTHLIKFREKSYINNKKILKKEICFKMFRSSPALEIFLWVFEKG